MSVILLVFTLLWVGSILHLLMISVLIFSMMFQNKSAFGGIDFINNAAKSSLNFLVKYGTVVEKPPAKQEMWVWSLGWEDPLEKEMAIHSSILVWETSWTEEAGGQSIGSWRVRYYWAHTHTHYVVRPETLTARISPTLIFPCSWAVY